MCALISNVSIIIYESYKTLYVAYFGWGIGCFNCFFLPRYCLLRNQDIQKICPKKNVFTFTFNPASVSIYRNISKALDGP